MACRQDYPHVSCLSVTIGGISYTAAPFTGVCRTPLIDDSYANGLGPDDVGWYLSTEIASRNLADENRYNALPEIARRMGLPTQNRTLWKVRSAQMLSQGGQSQSMLTLCFRIVQYSS